MSTKRIINWSTDELDVSFVVGSDDVVRLRSILPHGTPLGRISSRYLTQYRRAIRRIRKGNERLPLIFNDYMNCLMGDSTEQKLLALEEPDVEAGVEYFVIDAGWCADDNG